MLTITIPETELYNEDTNEFINIKSQTIQLEHSLLSISKWESKYHKPFLSDEKKTSEEILYYIKCMTITQNVKPETYYALSAENSKLITEYIEDSMTATTFYDTSPNKPHKKEIITSEIVYYWMIQANIPIQFEKWHFNRLMTLIKVISIKNDPHKKKMTRQEQYAYQKAQNEKRRARLNSKG